MFQPDKLKEFTTDRATARKVEAAPFTLEHLIVWLEGRNHKETFVWSDEHNCLFAQYAKQVPGASIGPHKDWHAVAARHFDVYCRCAVSLECDGTFGGALRAARAYKARAAQ